MTMTTCFTFGTSSVARLGSKNVSATLRRLLRRPPNASIQKDPSELVTVCQFSAPSFPQGRWLSPESAEREAFASTMSVSLSKHGHATEQSGYFWMNNSISLITVSVALFGLTFGANESWRVASSRVSQCRYETEGESHPEVSQYTGNTHISRSSNDECSHSDRIAEDTPETQPSIPEGADAASSVPSDFFVERNGDERLQIFTGTSNPELAREICSHLGMPLGRVRIGRFADGEVTLEILDEVRGKDVYVLQSAPSASSNSSLHASLMELFFMVSSLKRASAKRVTAVLPYMVNLWSTGWSYFRQTNQTDASKPFTASDISLLLTTMGVDRVVFVDVHTRRAEGFFAPISISNLQPQSLAIEYFKRKQEIGRSVVVVSTDNSGTEQTEAFMSRLQQAGFDAGMAALLSNRPERPQKEAGAVIVSATKQIGVVRSGATPNNKSKGISSHIWLVGDVEGKDCIIVDDIIDTGERAVNAAHALKSAGARRIYMYATHGLFSRGAIDRIIQSPIKEVVVTDTIRIPENLYCEKLRVISVSLLLAEAIRRMHHEYPLAGLHRDLRFDQKIVQKHYCQ